MRGFSESKSNLVERFIINAIILIFCFIVFGSLLSDCMHYTKVYKNPIITDAVVTSYREDTDDDGTHYYAHVTYTIDGVEYKDVKYDSSSSLNKLDDIGTVVSVKVDPVRRDTLLRYTANFAATYLMGIAIIIVLSYTIGLIIEAVTSACHNDIITHEVIKKYSYLVILRRKPLVVFLLSSIFSFILYNTFYMMVNADAFTGILLLCLAFTAITVVRAVLDLVRISNGQYSVRRNTLINKYEISDADSNTYYLVFQDGAKQWEKRTSHSIYTNAREGSWVDAVYLNTKEKKSSNKPFCCFDDSGHLIS